MGILIVDDSEETRLFLTSVLSDAGYKNLVTAGSAWDAFKLLGIECTNSPTNSPLNDTPANSDSVELFASLPVDLILMDVAMPEMDGIEACRKIKEKEKLGNVPVVMVSAMKETKLMEISFEAGASDYITKPLNRKEFLARIGITLRLKKTLDDHRRRTEKLSVESERLKETNRRLEKLSPIDELTGLSNRRQFIRQLDLEWRRAARNGYPLSLIMISVDILNTENNEHSRMPIDAYLRKVANNLQSILRRPGDLSARYDNDKFSVILPDTTAESAKLIAAKIRSAAAIRIFHEQSKTTVSVKLNFGAATVSPKNNSNSGLLLFEAKKELYKTRMQYGNILINVKGE